MHWAMPFIFHEGNNSSAEGLGSTPCIPLLDEDQISVWN